MTVLARWAGVPKEQSGQAAQRVAELWAEAKLQGPLGQPDARRRYGYREAALFPDIVETTKLLASRFWLRKALNG